MYGLVKAWQCAKHLGYGITNVERNGCCQCCVETLVPQKHGQCKNLTGMVMDGLLWWSSLKMGKRILGASAGAITSRMDVGLIHLRQW
jgi:hypothetical protein